MSAFIVTEVEVTDPGKFEEYRKLVPPTIEAFGGRYVVRGGAMECREGDWRPKRLVIIEFDDVDRAREWHDSDPLCAGQGAAGGIRQHTHDSGRGGVSGRHGERGDALPAISLETGYIGQVRDTDHTATRRYDVRASPAGSGFRGVPLVRVARGARRSVRRDATPTRLLPQWRFTDASVVESRPLSVVTCRHRVDCSHACASAVRVRFG